MLQICNALIKRVKEKYFYFYSYLCLICSWQSIADCKYFSNRNAHCREGYLNFMFVENYLKSQKSQYIEL